MASATAIYYWLSNAGLETGRENKIRCTSSSYDVGGPDSHRLLFILAYCQLPKHCSSVNKRRRRYYSEDAAAGTTGRSYGGHVEMNVLLGRTSYS